MRQKTDYLRELYADEAVCFIANRHNVTPQQLLHDFLFHEFPAERPAPDSRVVVLEPNEVEILKGLFATVMD